MKCSPPSQSLHVSNENCNNMNVPNGINSSNRLVGNSIVGIVNGPNLIGDSVNATNPSPIIQQQATINQKSGISASSPTMNSTSAISSAISIVNKSAVPMGSTGSSLIICGLCCQPICDRYIMKVVDTPYHERCLQCISCCCDLVHSCFVKDGKNYCRIDYER